ADPTRANIVLWHHWLTIYDDDSAGSCIAPRNWSRLSLNLLLYLTPEAVGVREAVLDFRLLTGYEVCLVSLARQRINNCRPWLRRIFCLLIGEQVVHQMRSSSLQNLM